MSAGRKRLLSDGMWVAVGQVGIALGILIGTRILTEMVSPAVFGTVGLLIGASTLGSMLLCTPLLQALLRFYPDAAAAHRIADLRRSILSPLRLGVLSIIGCLLVGGFAYTTWEHVPFAPVPILAGLALLESIRNFETTLLSAARRQRSAAFWQAADAWARAAFSVLAVVLFGPSTQSVLLGYLVGSLLTLGVARAFVRFEGAEAPTAFLTTAYLHEEIRRYAVPLIPLALVGWVASVSDRYIVAGVVGLREAGLYAAAYGLLNRPVGVGATILISTLRPVYYQMIAVGDVVGERRLLRMWLLTLLAALGVGVGIVTLASGFLTHLLLGPQYRGTSDLLPWLAVGFSFLTLSQVYNTVSLAYKRTWAVSVSELVGALASLAAAIPLTRTYGVKGTAAAMPLYYGAQFLVAWWLSRGARNHTRVALHVEPSTISA